MGKNKSHSGMAKRIKVSGTGKLMRERTGKRHRLERKSSKLTRKLAGDAPVAANDAGRVRRMLGR